MSDGYTELDLDATAPPGTPGAPADDGFEIVEEPVVAPPPAAVKPAAAAADELLAVERLQGGDNGKAADELRDQAEAQHVGRGRVQHGHGGLPG